MYYLAQPCDEFSDSSHSAKIDGAFATATKDRRPVLISAHFSAVDGFCGLNF